jgi:maltooligosyltrehalose trehalohydrolase
VLVYAENELQRPELVRGHAEGGFGCDGVWNDDFHHAARVAATGRHEAYYGDTRGTAQELVSAVKWGYLFQGQRHDWKKGARGAYALDLPADRFVTYLQNHDQVANSARGARLWQCTSPGRARAMRVLHLLAPSTPLLFQGEEYEAEQPFLYFADHEIDLAKRVAEGRLRALELFPSARDPRVRELVPDPHARRTFDRCKLDRAASLERNPRCREALALTRDLLALRREDPVFSARNGERLHGAVLSDEALILRFFGGRPFDDRLVVVNLGRDLERASLAEPLLAPSPLGPWKVLISSEDPLYGGSGTPPMDRDGRVLFPGQCALVFAPDTAPRA